MVWRNTSILVLVLYCGQSIAGLEVAGGPPTGLGSRNENQVGLIFIYVCNSFLILSSIFIKFNNIDLVKYCELNFR